jgi:hypothetical protein
VGPRDELFLRQLSVVVPVHRCRARHRRDRWSARCHARRSHTEHGAGDPYPATPRRSGSSSCCPMVWFTERGLSVLPPERPGYAVRERTLTLGRVLTHPARGAIQLAAVDVTEGLVPPVRRRRGEIRAAVGAHVAPRSWACGTQCRHRSLPSYSCSEPSAATSRGAPVARPATSRLRRRVGP